MKTETDDDQTIEISDDDGEPENVNTKTEDVTNEEEERNVEPRREELNLEEYQGNENDLKNTKHFRRREM